MVSRRLFIQTLPLAGPMVLAACSKRNPEPAPVAQVPTPSPALTFPPAVLIEEADPVAKGVGYVPDASRADKVRFKQWAAGRNCGNCQLFAGKPTDAQALCPIMSGRMVSAKGWCSAHVLKPI